MVAGAAGRRTAGVRAAAAGARAGGLHRALRHLSRRETGAPFPLLDHEGAPRTPPPLPARSAMRTPSQQPRTQGKHPVCAHRASTPCAHTGQAPRVCCCARLASSARGTLRHGAPPPTESPWRRPGMPAHARATRPQRSPPMRRAADDLTSPHLRRPQRSPPRSPQASAVEHRAPCSAVQQQRAARLQRLISSCSSSRGAAPGGGSAFQWPPAAPPAGQQQT